MGLTWLLFFLLAFVAPVTAETVTTENVLPNLSQFTKSNSTNSTGGTGNVANGGGTYTSTFTVPLTEAEVQSGFSINSAVTVDSHSSNAYLDTCTSITQASDCRDIVNLGITLFDGSDVAWKYTREIELDFDGLKDYTFTDNIASNTFGVLTGSFSLYGIDAGYHSGMYGPVFSNPSLTFAYQGLIEQQITDQLILIDMEIATAPPPPPPPQAEIEPMPSPSTSPMGMQMASIETEGPAPPPPPSIEMIVSPQQQPEQMQQEAQAEAAVEAELEVQQPEPEMETRVEPEVEVEVEPEVEVEVEPEVEAEVEPEVEVEVAATPRPQTRQQKVKAAAQRVVKKIAPSQRYSAANQTTTLVIMNIIAGKINTGVAIQDTQGFFPRTTIQDNRSMANPLTDYTLFGQSNGTHDAFIQLQWK